MVLIFDGRCGVCTRMAAWVRARDRRGRVRALPNQRPGVTEAAGLIRAQVDASVWAIDRTGARFAAAGAITRTLAELGGIWPLLARIAGAPVLHTIEDRAYHWFARHRARFARWGVTPACDHPDARCGPE